MVGKRQRSQDATITSSSPASCWWETVVYWITKNGGMIHKAIQLTDKRELIFVRQQNNDENKDDIDHNDDSLLPPIIPANTVIMKIPSSCLVTPPPPPPPTTTTTIINFHDNVHDNPINELLNINNNNENNDSKSEPLLYTSKSDLALAWHLATTTKEKLPYLLTLPEHDALCNALPRNWPNDQLESWFTGSPLLERIQKMKLGIQHDYQHCCGVFSNKQHDDNNISENIPSFQLFNSMLAAVSSRAFAINNDDTIPAMIPLLDLCNHVRGGNNKDKKNISYQYEKDDNSIIVTTTMDITTNGTVCKITYGAQSNSKLLLNYGFCLLDNIEPDGSSNDILEFVVKNNQVVELQTGPKSYTFGRLSKALQILSNDDEDKKKSNNNNDNESSNGNDDMEDFLNQCDQEEEDEDDEESFLNDMYTNDNHHSIKKEGEDEDDDNDKQDEKNQDLKLLTTLRNLLETRKTEYKLQRKELQQILSTKNNESTFTSIVEAGTKSSKHYYYAAILIQSEHRIIDFYIHAITKIIIQLLSSPLSTSVDNNKIDIAEPTLEQCYPKKDAELMEQQTTDLANAFLTIRYSDML